ncbi:MAG: right-handed parallel beta-helix repeat-containing protein [Phycisphaerae bacterium]|nr:right-handed parallel beta-helix repeat-containing protein [Phycisphaerae bacterium]
MPSRMIVAVTIGVAALTLSPTTHAESARIRVAPNGDDAKPEGPFATIQRARDEIRKLKKTTGLPKGGIEVTLAGGIYSIAQPIALTAEDSGTADSPVVYRAEPGATVRLVGGKVITGFQPVKDTAILERLDEKARGKVVQADLKALGITDYGSPKGGGIELFFNDVPMTVARWPNEGFVKIVEEAGGEKFDVRGRKGDRIGKWVYDGDRPKRWADENDVWVHGYWFWDWSDQRHKVKSIDVDKRTIEVEKPYHTYGYRKGQWYYAFNLLSEIDSPGEWVVDRQSGKLYFWPPSPIEKGSALVSVLGSMIETKDVSHVTFRGITIEAVRGTAIRVSGGQKVRVIGCTIRNGGGSAVSVSGGKASGVVGCDIYQMAGGGISLSGGDRKTLTPAGLFAENNHIHHYGRWYRMYQTAVSLNGVGNRASHNLIHDAPHMAIGFGGNDHLIEFNEIHSVCYESNDAGAMYAGRDWTMRGTVIRHNYLHHISGFRGHGCVGVYLDDMFCGTKIVGNLFYRVTRAAFIGGGRDNAVDGNLFVDCKPALHIDDRAMNWAGYHVATTMKERLDAVPYKQPPWSTRYPKLVTIWEDEPAAPKGNEVLHNVSFGGKWDEVGAGARKYQKIEDNLIDQDPRFATPDRMGQGKAPRATDFALKPDSPAYGVGFKALPLEEMGLQKSDSRATWPVAHQVRPVGK